MRSTVLKLVVILVVFGGAIPMLGLKEIDLKALLQWKVIFLLIAGLSIVLFLKWRRSMRLKDTPVSIQLLDD